jgi:hypothetical protein
MLNSSWIKDIDMKKIIAALILIVLVWFIYGQWQNKQAVKVDTLLPEVTESLDSTTDPNTSVKINQKSVSLIPESTDLPEGQLFHQDAMVDVFTGINHFAPCHKYFSNKPEDREQLNNLNQQQNQYLKPFFAACEAEKQQFEHYNKDKIMAKLMVHGLQIKQQKDLFNQDPASFFTYMNQADGFELLIGFDYFNEYVQSRIVPEIQARLNIKNHQVLKLVIDDAMLINACQKGVDCSYVSGLMMTRCMADENACGLSFKQYVDNHYLLGIKQEINEAANYLSSHFGW